MAGTPTIVTGYRNTSDGNSRRQKFDMAENIAMLKPMHAPLVTLTNQIPKKPAIEAKFEWLEDEKFPSWDAVNCGAGYAAGATEVVADHGSYFEAGNLIKVPRTGEVFSVTSVSTNTLTVVRGVGSTAAAAMVDNEPLMIMSDANEEGGTSRDPKITVITNDYNYTQIFKTSVGVTRTEMNSAYYGGDTLSYYRAKKAIHHSEKIERAFWWGERALVSSGTHPKRYTGGVFEYLTSHATSMSGMMTEWNFENALEGAFEYGSDTKWAFCSGRVISVINMWPRGKMEILPKDKTYGMTVNQYISSHGTLNIVRHPMFEGAVYGYYMAILDMADECIQARPLTGSDTTLESNIQAADYDGQKDQYLTEIGLQFKQKDRHYVLTDIES